MPEQLYALIKDQPFFKGMRPKHFRVLSNCAMEKEFAEGELIFWESEPANRFYLILEGQVALETATKGRGVVCIQTLGPGADLGWSWLFAPYYFHFSARATAPTKVVFFYGTRLRKHCEEDHDLGYEFLRRLAKVVVERLDATQRQLVDP
jgi:CRP/FNR family transcriptional regulator, cyclic AMP receptor protein